MTSKVNMSTPPGYLGQQRPNRNSTPVIPSSDPERYEEEGAEEAEKLNCKEVSSVPPDRVREKPRKQGVNGMEKVNTGNTRAMQLKMMTTTTEM